MSGGFARGEGGQIIPPVGRGVETPPPSSPLGPRGGVQNPSPETQKVFLAQSTGRDEIFDGCFDQFFKIKKKLPENTILDNPKKNIRCFVPKKFCSGGSDPPPPPGEGGPDPSPPRSFNILIGSVFIIEKTMFGNCSCRNAVPGTRRRRQMLSCWCLSPH